MGIGISLWGIWLWTGEEAWIRYYFDGQSVIFFLVLSGLELVLCLMAWSQFTVAEPLRHAWFFISMAAFCRLAGFIHTQLLGEHSALNPIGLLSTVDSPVADTFQRIGLIIGGPVHMVLLAAGLFLVLKSCRRFNLIGGLKSLDYVLLLGVGLYIFQQLRGMILWIQAPDAVISFESLAKWATDPLLWVLLWEAILLRRAFSNMGWGLIAKCWGAFAAAIFFTTIGDMGIWATLYGYLSWPSSSLVWYVWFPASCAYALAPAYQIEAIRQSRSPLSR